MDGSYYFGRLSEILRRTVFRQVVERTLKKASEYLEDINLQKYRVLKEKARRPSLLVGMDDVYTQSKSSKGNQYFASNFICSSKTFQTASHWFRLTAGYGFNTKGRNRLEGVFGGINYSPKRFTPLSLKAEYDTKRINLTGSLLIARRLYIYAGCFGKDKLAAGFAWRFLLD
jgi:hypothetical protein